MNYQGGLSNAIMDMATTKRHLATGSGGYFSSDSRTDTKDKYVEKALRATGLGDNGVATWLTSTKARHMSDNLDIRAWRKHVDKHVKNAFLDITVWSHPDHTGMLRSSIDLLAKLQESIQEYSEELAKAGKS